MNRTREQIVFGITYGVVALVLGWIGGELVTCDCSGIFVGVLVLGAALPFCILSITLSLRAIREPGRDADDE